MLATVTIIDHGISDGEMILDGGNVSLLTTT
jgi:hypothetical protein